MVRGKGSMRDKKKVSKLMLWIDIGFFVLKQLQQEMGCQIMVRCSEQIKKLSIRWRPPSRRGWRSCTAGQAEHEHYITIRHITSLDAVNPILTLPNVTILWSTQPPLKITSA